MSGTSGSPFPLATESPFPGGQDSAPGTANAGPGSSSTGDVAGASGSSRSGYSGISQEAMIAIIVVVSVVGLIGIGTSILFYVSKKREWKIGEKVRRSARKVVTALTPRRSEFPKSVKEDGDMNVRGRRVRPPSTPRIRTQQLDLENGYGKKEPRGKNTAQT